MQREAGLNAKGYSERDEKRILDALGRGLLKEFPNPDRAGCPGSNVLRKIASHEMPLAEAEKWLDHLTSCSPCYGDFSQFLAAHQRRRTQRLLAIAASILIVGCLAGWALFLRQKEPLSTQTAVLDLRNRSIARGTEPDAEQPPLETNRAATHWKILLPLGSKDGPYDVRIVAPSGEALMTIRGAAKLDEGVTSIQVNVALSHARPGRYLLQIQRPDEQWGSFTLLVR